MKKRILFYIAVFTLFSPFVFGVGEPGEFTIADLSSGMWSNPTPNEIPDNAAALIQNFTTDIEPLAVERNGYIKRDATILGGTKPVAGLWAFTDSTGSDWIVSFSSRTYYKNVIGGTPTAFGPTTSVDQTPDAAVNLGRIWFTNGTNTVWWFDGTSTGSVSSAPLGKLIEPWRNRLAIGNITGSLSTLRFSADGDGETWALGGNPTDPFSVQIGGANDGQFIRCLKGSYLDSLIVGRKYDLWAIDGFDQSDVSLRNISLQVGCIEPGTMQEVDNELLFLSARGIESMRGRDIRIISEPIRNATDVVVKNTTNQRSNTQTTSADWSAGSFDNNVYLDTNTASGNIQLTFPDYFSTFRDGTSGTKKVWDVSADNGAVGTVTSNGSQLAITHDGTVPTGRKWVYMDGTTSDMRVGTTFHFIISSMTAKAISSPILRFVLSTAAVQNTGNILTGVGSNSFIMGFRSTTSINATIESGVTNTPCGDSLSISTGIPMPFSFDVYTTTTNVTFTVNGSSVLASVSCASPAGARYYHAYFIQINASGSPCTSLIDDFGITPETATYTSQLLNIGNLITAWSPVSISDVKTNGSLNYVFGSTSVASVSSISNFTSIVNGGVPTVSTNPYAAFKAAFGNNLATATISLAEFQTTWTEGTIVPSPVSWVYDNRYWISFTTNTTTNSFQDSVFIYQRNKSWSIFKGINAASFSTWRDALYFGNSNSTGLVYKFDVGTNDDGSDIASRIISKSYNLNQPFREKDFTRAYCRYLANSAFTGNFSLTYDIDRYGTQYSLGSMNMNDFNGLGTTKLPFLTDTSLIRGYEIQYTLAKTGTGDRLRLHGISTQYQTQEER